MLIVATLAKPLINVVATALSKPAETAFPSQDIAAEASRWIGLILKLELLAKLQYAHTRSRSNW
jgi:hypothetical protein